MLSDKVAHRKPHRTQRHKTGWYTDAHKLECVKLWLITGNMTTTAAALNIPLPTVKLWKSQKWWKELSDEVRNEGHIELSQKLKRVAEKALDQTIDRLENGDWQYDPKSGQMIRKPVLMRDAHRVASDLLKTHLDMEKSPVQEEAMKATQDRLEALAQTFAGFAKKVKRIEVLDYAEDSGKTYKTIAGPGREETQGTGLQTIEQDGSHEGNGADLERKEEGLYDSGGESQRQAS